MKTRLTAMGRVAKYGQPGTRKASSQIVFGRVGKAKFKLTAHGSVWQRLDEALAEWVRMGGNLPKTMEAYNVRMRRGATAAWSLHSWALAWDCFASEGQGADDPKTERERMPDRFFTHLEDWGFVWGGRWKGKSYDPHHVEWPY